LNIEKNTANRTLNNLEEKGVIVDGIQDNKEYNEILSGVNKKYNKMHGIEEKKKEVKKERPEKLSLEE